ncbi:hypothetical protein R55214_HHFBAMCI_00209 [Fructobacillus evanidus]|uniref:DUF4044 domain-containing protein n=1 Tax=Fructobacillus evanidus TaxID=3064281 RepID=A0ABN9YN35_9LACO|nr:hypothetical protein R55250_KEHBDPNM_00096 [Fructobacillus sp. LMG 32999]CAK1221890.1 hypothetical protein R53718_MFFEMHAI_00097 [Fructobacillus sp. LMG 32999]CAK1226591.1 hypothetical protein R55234_GCHJJDIB_00096 [Fructobacillus sp. LMG 32999]CAK1227579.1 hypothetical protein R54837_OMAIDLJD_00198 [Fructobacillus sp. LMG 32999]CAK1227805.1 hypothetical protein R53534_HOPDCFKK_00199 [Fructobacillus sp. LMG 32999]
MLAIMARKKAKKKVSQTPVQKNTNVDTELQEEVIRQLDKRPIPKVEKKKKSRFQIWTWIMSIFMVVVMAGSVIYAAIAAIGH